VIVGIVIALVLLRTGGPAAVDAQPVAEFGDSGLAYFEEAA
jgi:hypothetical protein